MRQLKQLVNSPEGRHFLAEKNIFVNPDDFVTQLSEPANPALGQYLGLEKTKLIYAAQQTYTDCTQSMLDRITVLKELERQDGLFPFFIWVDTDRAGSDRLIMKFYWLLQGKERAVRLCPRTVEDREPRFIALERSQLQQAVETLTAYLHQTVKKSERSEAKAKLVSLTNLFLQEPSGTLSEFNHRLVSFVLKYCADFNPFSVICSNIINQNIISPEIDLFLHSLDENIRVFNETVEGLHKQDIDPQVPLLAADYLPLHYSCMLDHKRLKLHRQTKGDDTFAVATCSQCGETYQFYLGGKRLTMAELKHTGRWSPDVCLLLFLNDQVSGYVGGKSSTIYYGLVMNEVLKKVLNKARAPILIPQGLNTAVENGRFDGLIYKYLTGT